MMDSKSCSTSIHRTRRGKNRQKRPDDKTCMQLHNLNPLYHKHQVSIRRAVRMNELDRCIVIIIINIPLLLSLALYGFSHFLVLFFFILQLNFSFPLFPLLISFVVVGVPVNMPYL